MKRPAQLTLSLLLTGSATAPIATVQNTDVLSDITFTACEVVAGLHEQTRGRNLWLSGV